MIRPPLPARPPMQKPQDCSRLPTAEASACCQVVADSGKRDPFCMDKFGEVGYCRCRCVEIWRPQLSRAALVLLMQPASRQPSDDRRPLN